MKAFYSSPVYLNSKEEMPFFVSSKDGDYASYLKAQSQLLVHPNLKP